MIKNYLNHKIFILINKINKFLHNNKIFQIINPKILYHNKINKFNNKILIVIKLFPHKMKEMIIIIKVDKIISIIIFNNQILKKFINQNIKTLLLNKQILFPMKMSIYMTKNQTLILIKILVLKFLSNKYLQMIFFLNDNLLININNFLFYNFFCWTYFIRIFFLFFKIIDFNIIIFRAWKWKFIFFFRRFFKRWILISFRNLILKLIIL